MKLTPQNLDVWVKQGRGGENQTNSRVICGTSVETDETDAVSACDDGDSQANGFLTDKNTQHCSRLIEAVSGIPCLGKTDCGGTGKRKRFVYDTLLLNFSL